MTAKHNLEVMRAAFDLCGVASSVHRDEFALHMALQRLEDAKAASRHGEAIAEGTFLIYENRQRLGMLAVFAALWFAGRFIL